MKRTLLALSTILLCALSTSANVRLAGIFNNDMVLQRNINIPVWGWAAPGEAITVSFHDQTKKVKAGKDGKWTIRLDPEVAGGPFILTVRGKNSIVLNDVVVGDVWLCSGQSNMEFTVTSGNNAKEEIAAANFPMIRHIKIPNRGSLTPKDDIDSTGWQVCSPATVGNFTAVGYFFAREIYQQEHIPIGLINSTWGGTHVETWTSREAFEQSSEFKSMIDGLPRLNFDSLGRLRRQELVEKLSAVQGGLPDVATAQSWSTSSIDDHDWPTIKSPGMWEGQVKLLQNFDGVAWMRKEVELSAAQAASATSIELGAIDDRDITYLNGQRIGAADVYNAMRVYALPSGLLKPGKNVVAVRITDNGGGGGFSGPAENMRIISNSGDISLAGDWKYHIEAVADKAGGINPNQYPTLLFNSMINPLIPFGIKGALWYQGEANAGRAVQYRQSFPLMISDWRSRWKEGDFPFYFVQLATFNSNNGTSKNGSSWAELREAQTKTLSLKNTGMAITTDIGNPSDIHPKNKQDVGKRLAAVALNKVYGKSVEYAGPVYESMTIENGKATLHFSHAASGLLVHDRYGYVRGFEIAGADHQFHYAKAMLTGNTVTVYSDEVSQPVAVRYDWADDAGDGNLYNAEGFPAGPFRTDDWPAMTATSVYSWRE